MPSVASSSLSSSDSESSIASAPKGKAQKPSAKPGKAQPPNRKPADLESDSDTSSSEEDSDFDSDAEAEEGEDDTPVLSHAERRRQKKKQIKGSTTEPNTGPSDRPKKSTKVKNTAELVPSKVPKRQNSIWVGNLSFKTTPESLKKFFEGCGEITRVHMPMKLASGARGGAVKENRGFAYVDFATPDQKTVAIALSENHLDGRRLLIKDGGDFEGRPSTSTEPSAEGGDQKSNPITATKTAQKILSSQKQPPGPTIFFGNLGFETTEQSLRDLLTRNRTRIVGGKKVKEEKEGVEPAVAEGKEKETPERWIRKIRMGTFEDTGKCKGWAFVDFHRKEDATEALVNVRNHRLDGRQLVVEYASPDAVRRGGAGPRPEKDKAKAHASGQGESFSRGDTRPKRKAAGEDGDEGGDAPMVAGGGDEIPAWKKRRTDTDTDGARTHRYSRDGKPKARPKPGAALALAKRETATIVPSQGKKIVF
ncbi:hypothetical protein BXZ70DRAFT_917633 [Cristinia sonorae]|uniref:RRM domain-containing protein n=1 Tax=Cristinia sonorae TaxID=1940300 RepID=A0A8K0UWB0_9AGAR|nr:hypothetical protein BXZ70DRAFT_917633 [Cristinia sonorae]